MSASDVPLEAHPSDEQRERLSDWLTELLIISRRYAIVLAPVEGGTVLIDTRRDTVIGTDLTPQVSDIGLVYEYLPEDSVLDGVWLVDTDAGQVEQRQLGSIHAYRDRPPA